MNEIITTQRLDSLEEHQAILQQVLNTARERVLIISPYISISAINSEKISTLVNQAVARGVKVLVFVDSQRNAYSNGAMKDSALDGIAALVHAGAQVGVCSDIQRKVLSRDSDLIAEGSFNWLSAILFRSGEQQIGEVTTVYNGEPASTKISQELAKIEETEYELATVSECGGLEVTKAGRIFSLIVAATAPILIGGQAGNLMVGVAFAVLMLTLATGIYWLRSKRGSTLTSAQQN